MPNQDSVRQTKIIAALLAIFLGSFGAHKFYLGQIGLGILYLFFFWSGIPGIIGICEGIIFLLMNEQVFAQKYLGMTRPGQVTAGLPITNMVLRVARKHHGRITPVEVAADTALSIEEAKEELDKMVKTRACQLIVGEGGLLVYYFPEFESDRHKQDIFSPELEPTPLESNPRRKEDELL